MYPFATFPELLSFQIIAPFLLRVAAGLFIIFLGYRRYKKPYNYLAIFYLATGLLLIFGLYTQISAIVAIALLKIDFYLDYWMEKTTKLISKETWILYGIFVIISLTFLVSGPGFLAFDLPL